MDGAGLNGSPSNSMDAKDPQIEQHSRKSLRHALKQADPTIFDECLKFLMDHPRTMGSGYIREMIWRYMPRYLLTETQLSTIQQIALQYLERPMSREFKWMCLTMARVAEEQFWLNVKALLDSDNPLTQINAFCLYAYSEGVYAGERQRLKLKKEKLPYRMQMWSEFWSSSFPDEEVLYRIILDKEHWYDGRPIYKPAFDESDLPILYYRPKYWPFEIKLTSLDISRCRKQEMISSLSKILDMGWHGPSLEVWVYITYLFDKINYPETANILANFLEKQIDWKHETVTKSIMYRATLNVFLHYHTPEAMQAIKNRPQLEEILKDGVAEGYGWLLKKIP